MEASGQVTQEDTAYEETEQQGQASVQDNAQQEEHAVTEQENQQEDETHKSSNSEGERDRSGFVHGLAVGLGFGCIAAFILMWIAVFFTPRMPEAITYETMLSIFVYPLVYLLAVGLVALTAGIVREYYSPRR